MYGFSVTYGPDARQMRSRQPRQTTGTLMREWSGDRLFVRQHTLCKFMNDKLFADTEQYFIATEGVILNLDELQAEYAVETGTDLFRTLYEQYGETFLKRLRGSFCGLLYDKRQDVCIIYTDQQGSKLLFYTEEGENIRVSSSLQDLAGQTSDKGWDRAGLYNLLSFGFSPTEQTVVSGIRRLQAGEYLRLQGKRLEVRRYHRFANHYRQRTEDEEVTELDRLFRQAVGRIVRKNKQYGLRNLFPLSGGLDSRMLTWVAHDMSEEPIETYTYAPQDFADHRVPASIAGHLGLPWYYKALDGGDFLKNIDAAVQASDQQVYYAGAAEMQYATMELHTETAGVMPTGVGGDDIVSSPIDRERKGYRWSECALQPVFPEHRLLMPTDYLTRYESRNIYYLYTRSFNCYQPAVTLWLQNVTETCSPYLDTDFLEYVLSIPEQHRFNYRLYDRWVKRCYPEAARWPHNGKTIGQRPSEIYIAHRHIALRDLGKRVVQSLSRRMHLYDFNNEDGQIAMNPTMRWLQENPSLAAYIDTYYNGHIGLLDSEPQLQKRVRQVYRQDSWQGRMQALSVLAAVGTLQDRKLL